MIHRFGHTSPPQFIEPSVNRSDVEREYPLVQVDDPESADIRMADRIGQEIGWVSGAETSVYLRTENADVDAVQDADADPTYWPPILMKVFYPPPPPVAELKKWGINVELKPKLYLVISEMHRKLKRLIRPGDVIHVPDYEPVFKIEDFKVVNATPDGNYRYRWIYMECNCINLVNDITVMPNPGPTQPGDNRDS